MHFSDEYYHQPCMHFNELREFEMIKIYGDKPMADIDNYAIGPCDNNFQDISYRPQMLNGYGNDTIISR